MSAESLSGADGKCQYKLDENGQYMLSVSKEDFVPYAKELMLTKSGQKELIVPMLAQSSPAADNQLPAIQLLISGDCPCNKLNFVIYCPKSMTSL